MNNRTKNRDKTQDPYILDVVMRLARTIKRSSHDGSNRGGFGRNRLLKVIFNHNGASSKELAEILDIRPSSLAEMFVKLEKDGFIEKFPNEHDLRIVHVALTKRGKAFMHSEAESERQYDLRITGVLSEEEQLQFCEYCQRLIDACNKQTDL